MVAEEIETPDGDEGLLESGEQPQALVEDAEVEGLGGEAGVLVEDEPAVDDDERARWPRPPPTPMATIAATRRRRRPRRSVRCRCRLLVEMGLDGGWP